MTLFIGNIQNKQLQKQNVDEYFLGLDGMDNDC